jgi:hypothetical protein
LWLGLLTLGNRAIFSGDNEYWIFSQDEPLHEGTFIVRFVGN